VTAICARHGVPTPVIGKTGSDRLTIENRGEALIQVRVSEVRQIWSTALESALHAETHA
jgi:hypothetical protein